MFTTIKHVNANFVITIGIVGLTIVLVFGVVSRTL